MGSNNDSCCCNVLVYSCRLFGIITSFVLWGVGVEYSYYGRIFGVYLLTVAILLSFLESVFLLDHVVEVCVSRTSIIVRIWDVVLWIDDWKKGMLYFIFLSPPCFVRPFEARLGVLVGMLLVVTGVLYMFKTFKTKKDEESEAYEENNTSYDRFEDNQEDLDVNITNPIAGPTGMMSVADQSEILDL